MKQIGDILPGVMKGVKVYPFRKGEFFLEPRWISDLVKEIGPVPFAVRSWLKAHSNSLGCLTSTYRIAPALGLSRWTVSRALAALEEKGLIKRSARGNLSLVVVVDPPCPQKGADDGHRETR